MFYCQYSHNVTHVLLSECLINWLHRQKDVYVWIRTNKIKQMKTEAERLFPRLLFTLLFFLRLSVWSPSLVSLSEKRATRWTVGGGLWLVWTKQVMVNQWKGQSSASRLHTQLDVSDSKSSIQPGLCGHHQTLRGYRCGWGVWGWGSLLQITVNQWIHSRLYLQHRWGSRTSSNGQTIGAAASDG